MKLSVIRCILRQTDRKNKMITILNASIYSMKQNTEMAYEIEYSDGSFVRAVISTDKIIRREFKNNIGEWVAIGKPYVIRHDVKRNAERIIETVKSIVK